MFIVVAVSVNAEKAIDNLAKANTLKMYLIFIKKKAPIFLQRHFFNNPELTITAIHNRRTACTSGKEVGYTIKFKDKVNCVMVNMIYNILSSLGITIPTKTKSSISRKVDFPIALLPSELPRTTLSPVRNASG